MPKKFTKEEFVLKAKEIHGDKYLYNFNDYVNSLTLVLLYCNKHSKEFSTTPDNHIHNKGGCPLCRYEKSTKSQSGDLASFTERAEKLYGNKFDYSQVVYVNARTKVIITCKKHNHTFKQAPDKHFSGNGCGKCVKNGYNRAKMGRFYITTCGDITKVGITNRLTKDRVSAVSKSFGAEFEILKEFEFEDGSIASNLELSILKLMKRKYQQPSAKFEGSSECFLNVDHEWLLEQITQILTNKK